MNFTLIREQRAEAHVLHLAQRDVDHPARLAAGGAATRTPRPALHFISLMVVHTQYNIMQGISITDGYTRLRGAAVRRPLDDRTPGLPVDGPHLLPRPGR